MQSFIEKCKTTKLLGVIGSIFVILGSFLPFVKVSGYGISATLKLTSSSDAAIVIIAAVIGLLLILKDKFAEFIPSFGETGFGKKIMASSAKITLIPTIIIALVIISKTSDISSEYTHFKIGFFMIWLGIISLIAYAFLYKNENNGTKIDV